MGAGDDEGGWRDEYEGSLGRGLGREPLGLWDEPVGFGAGAPPTGGGIRKEGGERANAQVFGDGAVKYTVEW
jgi:hypothetical protein